MHTTDYRRDYPLRAHPGVDRFEAASPNSALRRAMRSNPSVHACPTCKTPNTLTPADVRLGYQCDACANADEGMFG